MSSANNQRGFSAVEAVVAILIVAAVAAGAWFVFDRMKEDEPATTTAAPEVNETSDLDSASKTLDGADLDASSQDSSDLDKELQDF